MRIWKLGSFWILMMTAGLGIGKAGMVEDRLLFRHGWMQERLAQVTKPRAPDTISEMPPPPASGDTLSLNYPELAPTQVPASTGGASLGPVSNIVIGGTLDYRLFFTADMPEGMFMIHVNELFLTANVGDHFSILAEQLLLTSDLSTVVGQDHGFVYVILSNLPGLPEGTAFRIGRMRLRYGIDAKLDGPANPLRPPEYRTLGTLSDRGIEAAGYVGPIEYVAAITMGPDYLLRNLLTMDGKMAGPIKTDAMNRSRPVFLRVGTDFKGGSPNIGFSGFYGRGYPILSADAFQTSGDAMLFGAEVDQTRLILKERATVDGHWNLWRLRFATEFTLGKDEDAGEKTVQAWYGRTDFAVIPQKLSLQFQYDYFDDGRGTGGPVASLGNALTVNITDESWVRFMIQGNQELLLGRDRAWVAGSQFLVAF